MGLSPLCRGRPTRFVCRTRQPDLRLSAPRSTPVKSLPIQMPQSEITRIYKGHTIVVKVLEDGFEYEGERYRSLSAIARAVTGSHWSGNRFFGLDQKGGAQ